MKKSLYGSAMMLLFCSHLWGQITFDYSAAELVLDHFTTKKNHTRAIVKNAGYRHILSHSRKYSSEPLTEDNLRNSLEGRNEGFDFSRVAERGEEYRKILHYLKAREQEIINDYAKLCLKYLPDDYVPKATIYYTIGGYNGIAFDGKICLNIDYEPFRDNYREIELYLAHELFHLGFENYQPLPDVFAAKTVRDLKALVLSLTMNEGLATLTPYHKRIDLNEVSDDDYRILLDPGELQKRIDGFNAVMKFLDDNLDKELDNEILGNVLGQCSGDRLFYIVGCHLGLRIEEKYGAAKIKELIKQGPEKYFETFYQITAKE